MRSFESGEHARVHRLGRTVAKILCERYDHWTALIGVPVVHHHFSISQQKKNEGQQEKSRHKKHQFHGADKRSGKLNRG